MSLWYLPQKLFYSILGFITFGCESACDFPFYHMCPFFAHESNALLFTFTWDKQRRMIGLGPTLSDAAKLLHRVSITDFISAHVQKFQKPPCLSGLLWTFPSPQTTLASRWGQKMPHSVSICELRRLSFQVSCLILVQGNLYR